MSKKTVSELDVKIKSLVKEQKNNDKLEHYIDMFETIDGYLKESSREFGKWEKLLKAEKKGLFISKSFQLKTEPQLIELNMFDLEHPRLDLKIKVDCKELLSALRFYYRSKLEKHIESNEKEIHININQLVGELNLQSKEEASDFFNKLSEALKRVTQEDCIHLAKNPNSDPEN